MTKEKIRDHIARMTLEEKAGLCSGADFWHTKAVERLGIPASMVSDGPHGLRKQPEEGDHLGISESIKAVCFPAGCATAASFDRDLIRRMGETLGNECQAEGVSVILGPAVNIKRSPLCGRNFEYYSEDPLLAGELSGALIEGVQSKNIGTSIKHFLANNQETRRMSISAEVDERSLREIYLAAFEAAVRKQKPWTVMCSYNKLNGVYVAESKEYLTDILRNEWGFDGYVVSDWGATNARVEDLEAGMDLEMPSSGGVNDALIVEAVKEGRLDESVLDTACERILNIVFRFHENRDHEAVFDLDKDHEIAAEVAEDCIVLLKNEGVLPLDKSARVAFIGKYARSPRFQGGGSSHINSHKVESAIDATANLPGVRFALGFNDDKDEIDEKLIEEAVELAKTVDKAVIFAGLPDAFESEGFDRSHMRMPDVQNELIRRVLEVCPDTVVVLHNGSPVEMPWADQVPAIVEAYLGGQAVGRAVVKILFGDTNPSGKLPETFPLKLEDNPSYLNFPGGRDKVEYREGIYVGYRYYNTKKADVLFPFGHGLSYTRFDYNNLRVEKKDNEVHVSVDITNSGDRRGKEAVQLYVACQSENVARPSHELREFAKVDLEAGETKTLHFVLGERAFSYWNSEICDWHVETADYEIQIAASSRDIRLREIIHLEGKRLPVVYDINSTIGDLMEDPVARAYFEQMMGNQSFLGMSLAGDDEDLKSEVSAISADMMAAMMKYMPLRGLVNFGGGQVTNAQMQAFVDAINQANREA